MRKIPHGRVRLIRVVFLLTIVSTLAIASGLSQYRPIVWSPERQITRSSGDSRLVDVSADPSCGLVYLTWEDNRGGIMEVYYKRSLDDGITWGPDVRLSNLTIQTLDPEPRLAADGRSILVFFANRTATGEHIFYVASYNGGTNFSTPSELTVIQGDQSNPAVAVTGSTVHLVWQELSDGGEHIAYTKSQDFGRTWQQDVLLTNDTAGQDQYPGITSLGEKVFVTWVRMYGGSEAIYVRVSLDSGETWHPAVRVSDYEEQAYPEFPAIASGESAVNLVWGAPTGVEFSRSSDSGETWSRPFSIINAGRQYVAPRIVAAFSKIGVVVAGIAGVPGFPSRLSDIFYLSSSDGGETWNEPLRITTEKLGAFALAPAIWSNEDDIFIVWEDNRNGAFAIFFLSRPDFLLLHTFELQLAIPSILVLAVATIVYFRFELKVTRRAVRREFGNSGPHLKKQLFLF